MQEFKAPTKNPQKSARAWSQPCGAVPQKAEANIKTNVRRNVAINPNKPIMLKRYPINCTVFITY